EDLGVHVRRPHGLPRRHHAGLLDPLPGPRRHHGSGVDLLPHADDRRLPGAGRPPAGPCSGGQARRRDRRGRRRARLLPAAEHVAVVRGDDVHPGLPRAGLRVVAHDPGLRLRLRRPDRPAVRVLPRGPRSL
ncbi:MAG: Cytochrome c oxidase polypeptide IV, partial [uncultured Friedmanniella sp.]